MSRVNGVNGGYDRVSRGSRANRTGSRLEHFVADTLDEQGYKQCQPNKFFSLTALEQPIWAAQVEVGVNIYRKRRRVDAILYHPRLWPDCLVIQCKWQAASGSVEEKYPFEVMNIHRGEFRTIIILDGEGYSDGAKAWLESEVNPSTNLLGVFSQGGLQRWVSQGRI